MLNFSASGHHGAYLSPYLGALQHQDNDECAARVSHHLEARHPASRCGDNMRVSTSRSEALDESPASTCRDITTHAHHAHRSRVRRRTSRWSATPTSSLAASMSGTRSTLRRTRTKMTMRINDLIRINILALSAMPAEARLWFRFWAWGRRARCACGTRRRLGRVAYRDRRRHDARMRRRERVVRLGELGSEFSGANERHKQAPLSCGGSSRLTSSTRGRGRATRSSERRRELSTASSVSPALRRRGECRTRLSKS